MPFRPPDITRADAAWAAAQLGLPEGALTEDAEARLEVVRFMGPMDVAACPGSGKTTLLVAKLAILAEKWVEPACGLCVLSHTNAARREIESRLGHTRAGARLLGYPHFVGTIHKFVTDYLALPWLRSLGYPARVIDSDVCEARRWRLLRRESRYALQQRSICHADICMVDTDFNVRKKIGSSPPVGQQTNTYADLRDACRQATLEGYLCYDDVFLWALELMEKVPDSVGAVRRRFPLLFVDEAQDNSELQTDVLRRLFMDGEPRAVRQRFGDENQAIFDFIGAKEAALDAFPDDALRKGIPDSYRFDQTVADLVDDLGVVPAGLIGRRPRGSQQLPQTAPRHTILLFSESTVDRVLPAYADLLLATFDETQLREGRFTAISQVHAKSSSVEGSQPFPHDLADYWPEYESGLSRLDPKPRSLAQHVHLGRRLVEDGRELQPGVDLLAKGLLRLAGKRDSSGRYFVGAHSHRRILRLLEGDDASRDLYLSFASELLLGGRLPTRDTWLRHTSAVALTLADALAASPEDTGEAAAFMEWADDAGGEGAAMHSSGSPENVYRFPPESPKVHIHLGSIHSVKGETHMATLVCDSFWYAPNLTSLFPWLIGQKRGWQQADGKRQKTRLKTHFVAMTRPSHLLCLALPVGALLDAGGERDEALVGLLEVRGWRLEWLEGPT